MSWQLRKARYLQICRLGNDDKSALTEASISMPPSTSSLSTYFDARQLDAVLATLELKVLLRFASRYKHIDRIMVAPVNSAGAAFEHLSVSFDTELKSRDSRDRILPLVRDSLLPVVQKNVVIHLQGGIVREPIEDDAFHIFMDATPLETGIEPIPALAWDIPVSSSSKNVAWKPSGLGAPIRLPEDNFAIAELLNNCLYLHYEMFGNKPSDRQLGVLLELLLQTGEEIEAQRIADGIVADINAARPANHNESRLEQLAVEFDSSSPRFGNQILAIIRQSFLPAVQNRIVVHVGNGSTVSEPKNDEAFHIYLGCSSDTTGFVDMPDSLWGIPTLANGQVRSLSSRGIPIIEQNSRFVVAEIVGDKSLYIFPQLGGEASAGLPLLARILTESLKELDDETFVKEIIAALPLALDSSVDVGLNGTVSVRGFADRPGRIISALARRILAPVIDGGLRIQECSGENHRPAIDGTFHVFFRSSPLGKMSRKAPTEFFGLPVQHEQKAFWPSGQGQAIADDSGYLMAEVVGHNLYIHQQLLDRGTRAEAEILARLFNKVSRLLLTGGPQQSAQDLEQAFPVECWRQVEACSKLDIIATPDVVSQIEQSMQEAVAKTVLAVERYYDLEAAVQARFGAEYDELMAIDKVLGIEVGDDRLKVKTDVLYCVDPRTNINREIGAFVITIYNNGAVRWSNKTRTVQTPERTMAAPHITSGGEACMGNMKDLFPKMIRDRQFAVVAMMAIAFVESVNVDDQWGRHINYWPKDDRDNGEGAIR